MNLRIFRNVICICIIQIIFLCNAFSQSGWISQTIGTRNYVCVKFVNSNTGFMIGSDGVILKTTNQGLNWIINSSSMFGSPVVNGYIVDENTFSVIAGGSAFGMVYTTTNGGNTWVSGSNGIPPVGNGYIWLKGLTFLNEITGYVCGNDYGIINSQFYVDGIIYKTTSSGTTWFQSYRGGFDNSDIKFKNNETGYTNYFSITRTTNGGISWGYHGSVGYHTFSLSNIFNDTIYSCGDSGKVYRSINGGIDWTKFYTPANDTLRRIYFTDSKEGYAISDEGIIIKTTNAGENWTLQNTGTTKNLRNIWFINKDTGFVVGDSGIILKTFTGGVLVNIAGNNSIVPDKFMLHQNYPNPFNPNTIINFQLPMLSYISLKVYDALGKEIVTLVNEKLSPGSYEVEFDGTNLPSGIYFCKIEAGDFKSIKRMMLIK